jgi:hypothetical protein
MALADVTIDTNVLLHSCNPIEQRHTASVSFLQDLLACTAKLAVDDGFSLDAAKNRSLICAEYLAKLVPGSLPSAVLIQLALTGRIVTVPMVVAPQSSKKLNQLVANRRDRTFVKVCANSNGKVLVTHDFDDFPASTRTQINKLFSINLLEAVHCQAQL